MIQNKFLVKLGNYTTYPIYSFFINLLYWIVNINKLLSTLKRKDILKDSIVEERDVYNILNNFEWKKDNFIDWKPWIITIIANDFKDDCDGAAVLSKWCYKQLGIDSNLCILIGETAHMVCILKSKFGMKYKMISNGKPYMINNVVWEKNVLSYFDNYYKTIVLI